MTTALSIQAPLSRSSIAIAAPVPTPTAGVPTLLTPPAVNPVPFPGAQNQELLSGQYNTNFYSLWNYVTLLATTLNGCSYVPGGAFASVNYTYPVSASASACAAGTGSTLSLSLAHGDYDDIANAQTITGAKTFSAAIAASAINISGNLGVSGGMFGVNETLTGGLTTNGLVATTASITNLGVSGAMNGANETLTGGLTTGAVVASSIIAHGTTGTYPYVSAATNAGYHIEEWTGTTTTSGQSHTFTTPFTAATSYGCFASGHNIVDYFGFNLYTVGSISLYSHGASSGFDAFCLGF